MNGNVYDIGQTINGVSRFLFFNYRWYYFVEGFTNEYEYDQQDLTKLVTENEFNEVNLLGNIFEILKQNKMEEGTLKEVAEKYYDNNIFCDGITDFEKEISIKCFNAGAKWKEEKLLSFDEEELVKTDNDKLLFQIGILRGMLRQRESIYSEGIEKLWLEYRDYTNNEDAWCFKEWLVEQFKKK